MARMGCRYLVRLLDEATGCRYLDQLLDSDEDDDVANVPGGGTTPIDAFESSAGCGGAAGRDAPVAATASGFARAYRLALARSAPARRARRRSRSPRSAFVMEWECALRMRPAAEPMGPSLAEALAPLFDMPLAVSCRILFEYQGRVIFYKDLALQTFVRAEVARWRQGQRHCLGQEQRHSGGGGRAPQRHSCGGGRVRGDGCAGCDLGGSCHIPSLADANVFPIAVGAMRRLRFREPQIDGRQAA